MQKIDSENSTGAIQYIDMVTCAVNGIVISNTPVRFSKSRRCHNPSRKRRRSRTWPLRTVPPRMPLFDANDSCHSALSDLNFHATRLDDSCHSATSDLNFHATRLDIERWRESQFSHSTAITATAAVTNASSSFLDTTTSTIAASPTNQTTASATRSSPRITLTETDAKINGEHDENKITDLELIHKQPNADLGS